MIPVLFPATATNFDTEGLGRLSDCTRATVTEERNGAYELVCEMPVDGQHFNDITLGSIIAAKPSPTRDRQAFEVYAIEKTTDGMMATVYCQHISYRLSLIPVMPFTASTLIETLAGLKSNSVETNPFTFFASGSGTGTYKQTVPSSVRNRLLGEQGSVLQTFRGIEYLWDNFRVYAAYGRGADRGVKVVYGKNLVSLKQEQNIQNTITGVLPYWVGQDGGSETVVTLPERVIYTDNAGAFPFHRTVAVDFSGDFETKPTEAQLRARTQTYIADNDLGVPKVNLDITPAALSQMADYAEVGLLERVELCDTVRVVFPMFGVTASAKVVKTVYNVLEDMYDSYDIGSLSGSLGETIASAEATIKESARQNRTYFQQALADATAILNGDITGSRMITITDVDGNPQGFIIMDTADPATAVNCIRVNTNGIGFSNQGVNGPYSSAWTIDNTLNMENINVLNLVTAVLRSFDSSGTTMLESESSYLDIRKYNSAKDRWEQRVGVYYNSNDDGYIRLSSGNVGPNGQIYTGETYKMTFMSPHRLWLGLTELWNELKAEGELFAGSGWFNSGIVLGSGIGGRAQIGVIQGDGTVEYSAYKPMTINTSSGDNNIQVLGMDTGSAMYGTKILSSTIISNVGETVTFDMKGFKTILVMVSFAGGYAPQVCPAGNWTSLNMVSYGNNTDYIQYTASRTGSSVTLKITGKSGLVNIGIVYGL